MNAETILLRQIHPSFFDRGRVSSQAFRPTPKDESKLSAYNGDLIAPQPAYLHYTETLRLMSIGVQGVAMSECEALDLRAMPDPEPFPEHAVIDFTGFSKNDVEKKAKALRTRAEHRGWLHGPVVGLS